jgi:hypothetical protein
MLMAFLHSHPAILDGLKLAAVGVFIETCRRGFQYLASAIATGKYLPITAPARDIPIVRERS